MIERELQTANIETLMPDEILGHMTSFTKIKSGLFLPNNMNECMEMAALQPIPQMLFGAFWFESEVCILFADTNLGKSILAYQIADAISKGTQTMGLEMEARDQKVLYFDFELSLKQLLSRYSDNYSNPYTWSDNLIRAERNPDDKKPDNISTDDYLNTMFEQVITGTGAKIIIIDNITALRNETEKAKDAIPLMSYLRELKNKLNLSILVIAHTPKRDLSRPVTENDLAGSKQLMNLCDNSFAIGRSCKDDGLRYLKQIKPKFTPVIYGYDNVLTCYIEKQNGNFLRFVEAGSCRESDHLRHTSDKSQQEQTEQILQLHNEGKSLREIAKEVGVSYGLVNRRLKKLDVEKMPF